MSDHRQRVKLDDEDELPPFELPTVKKTGFILKEKIADMIKYGKPAIAQFPRRERQTADEIRASMLTMYRLTVVLEKKYYKKTTLQELDVELDVLRHFIRLAQDKDYYGPNVAPPLPFRKYEYWSRLLDEIGRIIGGLTKVVVKTAD